tara:strand:- start:4622 stop:4897 length:276 start_codon:yes stop_codon:yes gene_type:complete
MNKKNIKTMNRNELREYLFLIQDYFKKSLDDGLEMDYILDNTTILDDFENYLPEEEYPIFVMTILNGFRSEDIISNIIKKIEFGAQINNEK